MGYTCILFIATITNRGTHGVVVTTVINSISLQQYYGMILKKCNIDGANGVLLCLIRV